jgi:hypothetical protein
MQSNDEFVTQPVTDMNIAQTPVIVVRRKYRSKEKTQTEHP